MATFLSTLQTVLHTFTAVAYVASRKAKSDLLALAEMMLPLDALAGEIAKPQHE